MKTDRSQAWHKAFSLRYRRGKGRLRRTRSSRLEKLVFRACVCAQHDNALVACSVEGSSSESGCCALSSYSLGLKIRRPHEAAQRGVNRNRASAVGGQLCRIPWLYRVSIGLGGRPTSCSNDEYPFVDRIPTAAGSRSGSPSPNNGQSRGAIHQTRKKVRL